MYWDNDLRFYYHHNLIIVNDEEDVNTIAINIEYRVFAIDGKSYFIKNLTSLECFWCYANKLLALGEVVSGQLLSTNNPGEIPTLIITEASKELMRQQPD
ncbi:hypothetical protein G7B40_027440 [Aetokthonos hydrillicola Thurmond2011]|jgi:hypothetical protein|uniref:Uncharacterized protein n=1 Tax=Aetokthonos hydrillicola Thurmond2011 TaxID=2712845 RepID=A0AAP5MAM3_9CYAN|nr:hypothetical protein [Aetokthonos hydrillicola]MBO3463045.1 hypothetical protein [Aetokthonos hydrillicola CCALA 1050]MBW4588908.1 hypothetical protein [Aetokthonos hydrillicola CCALA 1050]MDR9898265.1 hypothetical protein [Aetokthonos hydrillicola Thurmond2011]